MSDRNPDNLDLSRACWRCQHCGGLVVAAHANCTRPNSSLKADPVTGCAYWTTGPGDQQHLDWLPEGYKLPEKVMIWGKQVPPSERPRIPTYDERPGVPADALAWDQRQERDAWRAADSLLSRTRGRAWAARDAQHQRPE